MVFFTKLKLLTVFRRVFLRSESAAEHHQISARSSITMSLSEFSNCRSLSSSVVGTAIQDAHDAAASLLNETIMSVDQDDRGTVGCAYYRSENDTLYLMEDLCLAGSDIIRNLKSQIGPATILTSSSTDHSLLNELHRAPFIGIVVESGVENVPGEINLDIRPKSEFSYHAGKAKLMHIRASGARNIQFKLHSLSENMTSQKHNDRAAILFVSELLQSTSQITVGCVAALISYLHSQRNAGLRPGMVLDENGLWPFHFEIFSLQGSMFIDSETLNALQIFPPAYETHRSNRKSSSTRSMQSGSLRTLFGAFLHTPQGRQKLTQYLLRPSTQLDVIEQRLNSISLLLLPENQSTRHQLAKDLSEIKNITRPLSMLRVGLYGGTSKAGQIARTIWTQLINFSRCAPAILSHLSQFTDADQLKWLPSFDFDLVSNDIIEVGNIIDRVVDLEESSIQSRTVIKKGIDSELDDYRDTFNEIGLILRSTAERIRLKCDAGAEIGLDVIYFPSSGFFIATDKNFDPGRNRCSSPADSVWQRVFSTDSLSYYKNDAVRDLDSQFGHIYGVILSKEIELIYELGKEVLRVKDSLFRASDICGELDCLLALSEAALKYDLVRPKFVPKNVIHIRQGRHLIQETTNESFVPNDTYVVGLEAQYDDCESQELRLQRTDIACGKNMTILTGPNCSGKSVYLEQVALIVYLAQIGSFVPANCATLGLTDQIIVCVSQQESVSFSQSAFKMDLDHLCRVLRRVTCRSLLILDEPGKGTSSDNGAGLAFGVLEHLLSSQRNSPKMIIASHFHELFEHDYLADFKNIRYFHMKVKLKKDRHISCKQIAFFYALVPGRAKTSLGTVCAQMSGVSHEIVQRAEKLVALIGRGVDLKLACTDVLVQDVDELQIAVGNKNLQRAWYQLLTLLGNHSEKFHCSGVDHPSPAPIESDVSRLKCVVF